MSNYLDQFTGMDSWFQMIAKRTAEKDTQLSFKLHARDTHTTFVVIRFVDEDLDDLLGFEELEELEEHEEYEAPSGCDTYPENQEVSGTETRRMKEILAQWIKRKFEECDAEVSYPLYVEIPDDFEPKRVMTETRH